MAEACDVKDQMQIQIFKTSQAAAAPAGMFLESGEDDHQKAPFFKHLFGKNKNPWIVSFFVIVQIAAFSVTMFVNDCWGNSHGDCALKPLGRLSFQPLSENPLLGPSASALDAMGALRQPLLREHHQSWRLFTFLWLHGGAIHFIINLTCLTFIGVHLEQEFGPLRIGTIYGLSALDGSLLAALSVQNNPAVGASGGLFGLLGAMLAGIIRNWGYYSDKFVALLVLLFVFFLNFMLGLLPYIDNFANIGAFMSGFLLGFVLLFNPQLLKESHNRKGLFDYSEKSNFSLKQKLDKPVLRITSLILFSILITGALLAYLRGMHVDKYCSWCQYINCIPSKKWICNDNGIPCETMVSSGQLTLTCTSNGNFRVLHYTNVSDSRLGDLCSLICS